jgi:hypothetical protein
MTGKRVWALFRLVMAVGTLWALLVQFGKVDADPELTVGGFLSLFTNESNFLAALSLIVGGIWMWRGQESPDWFDFARGALVTWLALTGIVFLVLLADPELRFKYHINEPSDQLHKAMPLFLLVDWLVFPPRKAFRWKTALWWTVPPLAFCAYSLIRGRWVDWYPYDFLDPREQGGYGGVALYVVGMSLGFLLFSALVVWLGNTMAARRVASVEVVPQYSA